MAASEAVRYRADQLIARSAGSPAKARYSQADGTAAFAGDASPLQLPGYSTRLADVDLFFKLAAEAGVKIGPIDYRTEAASSLPLVVRMLDLRLSGDYPNLKSFIAQVLNSMPHAYVREIQISQASGAVSNVQLTLKLSLVYQGTADAAAAKQIPGFPPFQELASGTTGAERRP